MFYLDLEDDESTYDIRFKTEPNTVEAFLNFLLKSKKNEFGTVTFTSANGEKIEEKYDYKYGKTKSDISEEILKKKIIEGRAIGGWTLMNYELVIE